MTEPRPHFGVERYISALHKRLGRYFERSTTPDSVHGGPSRGDRALVIGIYGPWGCGKTTWLQQLDDRVARDNKRPRFDPDEGPISLTVPILFNAWQFEREPHLIVPLLKTAEVEVRRAIDISIELTKDDADADETTTAVRPFLRWASQRAGMLWDATLAVAAGLDGSVSAKIPGGLADAKIEYDLGKARFALKERRDKYAPKPAQPSVLDAYESIYYELRLYMETLTGRSSRAPDAVAWLERAATRIEARLVDSDAESVELDDHELEIFEWWSRRQARQSHVAPAEPAAKANNYRLNLLFLIDDLDRCLPEKAVEMLESIKLFLEVPGCAFVLAVDDEIVERGIRHRYKDYLHGEGPGSQRVPVTGAEYLEKIIHLPVRVPPISRDEIRTFLLGEYAPLFGGHDDPVLELFERCVPPVPRKLIRAAEVFGLLDELAREQVAQREFGCGTYEPLLLARLVLLQLFAPEVYRLGARPRGRGFLQDLKQFKAPRISDEIRQLRAGLDHDAAGSEGKDKAGPGQRKLDEQRLRVALEVQGVLEQRSGFDPCGVVENEDYDWDTRVAAHYCVVPQPTSSELTPPDRMTKAPAIANSGPRAGQGQPHDLDAFVDLIFADEPETWRRALAEEREQLEGRLFSTTTVERILERARVRPRGTLVWLAWFELFAPNFHPSALGRVCRGIGLLRDARDPALVLSRLCRIVNSPQVLSRPHFGRGFHQLVLRDYLEGEERRTLLIQADFQGCYLVGLDGRGVELPRESKAWTGADLRFSNLDPEVDTRSALRDVGRVHALDLPVARGGGGRAVRHSSGVIISAHGDGTLQVWSKEGPLAHTLWIGEEAQALSCWGDALATIQWKCGLTRRSVDGRAVSLIDVGDMLFARVCELPDGRMAVTEHDGVVGLYSPDPSAIVEQIQTGQYAVGALSTIDGALIWGAEDGSIGVHPLSEGDRQIMRGEDGRPIRNLAPLEAGRFVAGNHDGLMRVWSKDGSIHASFDNGVQVSAIVTIAGGIATGDGSARIRLWRDGGVEEVARVPYCVWDLVGLDERRMWSVSKRLQVWTTVGELRREIRDIASVRAAAINDEVVAWVDDEHRVWSMLGIKSEEPRVRATKDIHDPVRIRVDGTTIFASSRSGNTLMSWNGEHFVQPGLVRLDRPWGLAEITDFIPLRGGIAFTTKETGVQVRRRTRSSDDDFEALDDPARSDARAKESTQVDALAASPDGERFAVAYRGAWVEVYGTPRRFELGPEVGQTRCLCWLDDDVLVAAHGGGLTRLANTGVEHLPATRPDIACLARGRSHTLLAGCVDGSALLWSALDDPPRRLHAHHHEILALHERADGTLVTVALDGVRFWGPDGVLREQLNVLSESVVMWIRPDEDWPIALETLDGDWSLDELHDWVGAFVTDARRNDDPDAPIFRVPLNVVNSEAWSWEGGGTWRTSRIVRLRWPEDRGSRDALQQALLGPAFTVPVLV